MDGSVVTEIIAPSHFTKVEQPLEGSDAPGSRIPAHNVRLFLRFPLNIKFKGHYACFLFTRSSFEKIKSWLRIFSIPLEYP